MFKIIFVIAMIILAGCTPDRYLYEDSRNKNERTVELNFFLDFTSACYDIKGEVFYSKNSMLFEVKEKIFCFYENKMYSDLFEIQKLALINNNK